MQNTQLYPVVEINGTWYSTNNVTVDGNYCKPILMNIPSIKESVDIESRKFKISNVSLQFNNFPFEGVRFSDQLSETSLINKEAIIYFKSQSDLREVFKGIIRRLSHDDEKVSLDLEDLTEKKAHKDLPSKNLGGEFYIPDKYKNKPIPMVYGYVDRSPLVGIQELTDDVIGDSDGDIELIADYKEIMFREGLSEDSHPLYIKDGEYEYNVLREKGFSLIGHSVVGEDDEYINQYKDISQYDIQGSSFLLKLVYQPSATDSIYDYKNLFADDMLQVYVKMISASHSIASVEIYPEDIPDGSPNVPDNQYISPTVLSNTNYFNIYDNSSSACIIEGDIERYTYATLTGTELSRFTQFKFIRKFKSPKDSQFGAILFSEVSFDLTRTYPAPDSLFQLLVESKLIGIANNYSHSYDDEGSYSGTVIDNGEYSSGGAVEIFASEISGGDASLLSLDNFSEGTNFPEMHNKEVSSISGFTGHSFTIYSTSEISDIASFQCSINEIQSSAIYDIKGVKTADYYGDINGRVNTFSNHPQLMQSLSIPELASELLSLDWQTEWSELGLNDTYLPGFSIWLPGIANESEEYIEDSILGGYFQELINSLIDSDEFIQNPIDIIYDLVRSELGHENIDVNQYEEAKLAHDGWKFGFTINKKISSKKLIEDIAKSTKCFPKFKNDGSFGFNTVKDSYTVEGVDSDYAGATPIKESEVISYSFKKTKPEQIYKKVTVSYNKDYAQDSYLKTTDIDLGADDYYGIEDSADAHLEFESDYIRDEETANLLASFLSEQYKNDHLIFNLKLPLQYIDLEIGDLVKFENLFQGVAAYGIDYTDTTEVNGQSRYPLFMVTSTTKNLDSVSIECMQLHHLEESIAEGIDYVTYDGDDIEISGNVQLNSDNQSIAILVNDSYDYSGLLGDSQYFKISGIERPVLPESGDGDIVSVTHIYNSNEDSPNHFILSWVDENDGVLSVNDSASFGLADDEQITITLSSYDLPASSVTGDVNLDGGQSILDIVQMVNYTLGDLDLNQQQLENADMNNDGIINILDIVQLVNAIMD